MFTHLHVHTEYSLLDGMCRIKPLVERAKALGMTSLAITDHGVMYGAIQFYSEAVKAGIKPIIGCEVYVASESRTGRTAADKKNYHLILLAKNQAGYRNLIQLTNIMRNFEKTKPNQLARPGAPPARWRCTCRRGRGRQAGVSF